MPSIFDFVNASNTVAFWETRNQDRAPYLGETLFDTQQKLGLDLKWIKGASGLPVVLAPSAFDVEAKPRTRVGFTQLMANMPFFKESLYIDEELRQQLNIVLESGNQAYIETITRRIFNDNVVLLEAAAARREMMRMSALTTGVVSVSANGQAFDLDYGVPTEHKVTVTKSWSDPTADIAADILAGMDKIEDDTGVRPNRAVVNRKLWTQMLKNKGFVSMIYVMAGSLAKLTDADLKRHLMETYGLQVVVYSKKYTADDGKQTPYVADNSFTLFPEGLLGTTWMGTTPEQSDLMSQKVANVSITDGGVAVTTIPKADPVNVETKVTMISLPSFEQADKVYQLDTQATA